MRDLCRTRDWGSVFMKLENYAKLCFCVCVCVCILERGIVAARRLSKESIISKILQDMVNINHAYQSWGIFLARYEMLTPLPRI